MQGEREQFGLGMIYSSCPSELVDIRPRGAAPALHDPPVGLLPWQKQAGSTHFGNVNAFPARNPMNFSLSPWVQLRAMPPIPQDGASSQRGGSKSCSPPAPALQLGSPGRCEPRNECLAKWIPNFASPKANV